MKITFYPAKESILARLGHSLKSTQEALDKAETELKELEESIAATNFYNPEKDKLAKSLKTEVQFLKVTEEGLQDTIGLLENAGETVQAETEV